MRKPISHFASVCTVACVLIVSAGAACGQDTREDAQAYYKLGNAYYGQGRYREAQEMYEKALSVMEKAKEEQPSAFAQPAPAAQPPAAQAKPAEAVSQGKPAKQEGKSTGKFVYVIGEGDVLAISVWQNQDLDQQVTVRPDGMISFPLVGDMTAQGLTVPELTSQLTEKLKEFVRFPQVSISIQKVGGKRVIVLGEVASPGIYSLSGSNTLFEAIGMAGGFTTSAVASSVVLIRGGFSAPKAERINLSKALATGKKPNITLNSEDIVFVPKKFIANLNYFLNQVLDPLARGAYTRDQLRSW